MVKKLFILNFLFILGANISSAQNFLKEYGKIAKDEIELQAYALDKEAEAVVLFDIGKSYFVRAENSFNVVFERTTRVKILSEAGIKWAEVGIPYYQEGGIFETISDIEATSYNYEDGQIHRDKLDVSNTYDEKINDYWNLRKFAVPNVKVGTILEYKYKINSQYKFNLRDWEFQWRIPVIYSEYEVKMTPFYEYSWLLQGASGFDVQDSFVDKGISKSFGSITYQDMVHKYIMKDVPAFDNEAFITSINDYLIKIDFQLKKIHYTSGTSVSVVSTWSEMIKDLLKSKDFGNYVNRSEKLASKQIKPGIKDSKSEIEKFEFALDYMKENFNWNGYNGKFASKTPGKLLEDKHGNSADINLFTIGLLNSLGIKAQPVLISTRENGKIKYDYPYVHFFNYVIILANVDGKDILTDATEVLCLNDRIPSRCINEKGLVIQKDLVEWVGLESTNLSVIKTEVLTECINPETIHATIFKSATEYDALFHRKNHSNTIETLKKNQENNDYSIVDTSIVIQNQLDKKFPYISKYKITGRSEIVNEKIYLSPFLDLSISDNPLKQKSRTYPIDMTYPIKRIFNATIQLPDGYSIDYLPSNQNFGNELCELVYSTKSEGKQVNITFEYSFKKSIYSPRDYSKMKYYFNEIVKKGNEKIVLSKNEEVHN